MLPIILANVDAGHVDALAASRGTDNSIMWVIAAVFVIVPGLSSFLAFFITRREAEKGERKLEERIDKMEKAMSDGQVQSSASRKVLYDHVDTVRKELSGKVEEVRRELSQKAEDNRSELSAKIDTLPGLIIAMLNNTGALRKTNH